MLELLCHVVGGKYSQLSPLLMEKPQSLQLDLFVIWSALFQHPQQHQRFWLLSCSPSQIAISLWPVAWSLNSCHLICNPVLSRSLLVTVMYVMYSNRIIWIPSVNLWNNQNYYSINGNNYVPQGIHITVIIHVLQRLNYTTTLGFTNTCHTDIVIVIFEC